MSKEEGRHVFDAIGMTRIVIENGEVAEVGESELSFCPIYPDLATS
ncbi:MAG: DUF2099 family protein [Thermoplasmata archaeon]|nr:DUF2099 family protein [Thermoplasmata archaeon]